MNDIYLSTSIDASRSLPDIVALAARQGADGIELGPTQPVSIEAFREVRLTIRQNPRFLIHNYFPHPAEAFVLNLASEDPDVLRKTLVHCRQAIDLCVEVGSPCYSVHAGFAFHANPGDLGKPLLHLRKWPLARAGEQFEESLRCLCRYGQERRVRILIENNVLAPFNLVDGRNEMLLGVTAQDLLDIVAKVGMSNLGLLIDVGHLKVSSGLLGFSTNSFLDAVAPFVEAFHLSDNDGVKDDNRAFWGDAWFLKHLVEFPTASLVIEVCGAGESEVGRMISLLRR